LFRSGSKAKSLFKSVLRRDPSHAETWHSLGELLGEEGDTAGRLLSYRISSCLNESHEHYALAYSDALCNAGRKEEGFAWLEARARRVGVASRASDPWVSWIHALEHWGYPECWVSPQNIGEITPLRRSTGGTVGGRASRA